MIAPILSLLLGCILPVAVAYFLGAVPFGLVIAKTFCGIDPRFAGSNNVGATNVARLCGVKWGALTLICDLLKGFLPVFAASLLPANLTFGFTPMLTALAAVMGHMFPVFLNFKGGKGVATTVGVFLALAPQQLIIAGVLCILVIWRTKFVSAGSLTLVVLLPLLLLFKGGSILVLAAVTLAALVIYAHRENIKRLLRGEEKPWLTKPSAPKDDTPPSA